MVVSSSKEFLQVNLVLCLCEKSMVKFDLFFYHSVGIYALDVFSTKDHFPIMKLKVVAESQNVSVVEYKYLGGNRLPATYPIVLTALAPIMYQIPKPPFSIVGMLMANPMLIMMLFSTIMVVGFPMMLKGLSPEELEEMKRNGAGDPMKQLTDLMGVKKPANNNDDDD